MIKCLKCGTNNDLPAATACCRVCGNIVTTASAPPSPPHAIAWDRYDETTVIAALVRSVSAALLHPRAFSRAVASQKDAFRAILFAVVVGSITTLITTLLAMQFPSPGLWSTVDGLSTAAHNLMFCPAAMVLKVVLIGAYIHGMLYLTGHRKSPFSATVRGAGYACAASCLSLIPTVGEVLSAVLFLYILLSSTSLMFDISRRKLAMILVLPGLILTLMAAVVMTAAAGAGLFINDTVKELIFSLQ